MDKSNKNHSIKCTVDSCKYHCDSGEYCALSQIQVGSHSRDETTTDCKSFTEDSSAW